jgi:hypothetical protein
MFELVVTRMRLARIGVIPDSGARDGVKSAGEPTFRDLTFPKETLISSHPGQNQHATQEAWFLGGLIFKRLRA